MTPAFLIGLLDTADAHHAAAVDDVEAADQVASTLQTPASVYSEALVAFARAGRVSEAREAIADMGITVNRLDRRRVQARFCGAYANAMEAKISDADDGRAESPAERLDRNTIELLNELRIAGTGIQVMFAFLLVVPFDTRFRQLSAFEHTDYFVTLLLVAGAAILLMAPPIHHRLLFRRGEKRFLISIANQLAISGMGFLALGFAGILVLLSDVVVGGAAPVIAGVLAPVIIGGLWFVLPFVRRAEE